MPLPEEPWQSLSMGCFYFRRTQNPNGKGEVHTLYVITDVHSNYCIPMMVDSVGFTAESAI